MLKADLHLHSKEDKLDLDIVYSAKELIDYASKLGFEVLAFTFHRTRYYNEDLKKYAAKKGILLIPGMEALIEGSEVLLLNITENPNVKTLDELRKYKQTHNIAVIAPHPFFPRFDCLHSKLIKNIDIFDGIEYSHFYIKPVNFNRKAARTAKKYNLPLIGTSDAHKFSQMNHTYSLIDSKKNAKSVIESIRNGKVQLKTQPLPFRLFLKLAFWLSIHLFD